MICHPESEALFAWNASVYMQSFMEALVFAMLFAFMFVLVKRLVVGNMQEALAWITVGNLEVLVDARDNGEFAYLSDDINSMVAILIPTAMFMMTVKALSKGFAESGVEVNDVFSRAMRSISIPTV